MKRVGTIVLFMFLATGLLLAEDWDVHRPRPKKELSGLSAFIGAGALLANDFHADFYSGRDDNANTIYRILHSEQYGLGVWQHLYSEGLITDAVGNYQLLTVDEFAHSSYRVACQLSFGIRYDYESGFGWLLKFDYAKLTATGAFLLSRNNHTGILSDQAQYLQCGMFGQESRINIDLGLLKRMSIGESTFFEVCGGLNINNTKIENQQIEIAGTYLSILDVWNGHTPSAYTQAYEYINQGGIGYGGFGSLSVGYMIGHSEVDMGYTMYYSKLNLQGYDAWKPQHLLFIRFTMNDFSFFN